MGLSSFQVEAMLEEFWKQHLPAPSSRTSQLSEESRQYSRTRLKGRLPHQAGWVAPGQILAAIADTAPRDPAIEYEELRRAGRFLEPPYVPPNPLPPFTRVQGPRPAGPVETTRPPDEPDALELPMEAPPASEAAPPEADTFDGPDIDLGFDLEPADTSDAPPARPPSVSELLDEDDEDGEADLGIPQEPETLSAADLAPVAEADEEDIEALDEMSDSFGLVQLTADDADVVFGNGKITIEAMIKFVQEYPESALKYLLRRDIDGRPLPREHEEIHRIWENRELKRPILKHYILKMMDWEDFPDMPIHELLGELRTKLFQLNRGKKR